MYIYQRALMLLISVVLSSVSFAGLRYYDYDVNGLKGRVLYEDTWGAQPLIIIGHGNPNTVNSPCDDEEHLGMDWLGEQLVKKGFVVAMVNICAEIGADPSGAQVRDAFSDHIDLMQDFDDGIGCYQGLVNRVDTSKIGIIGHSRGGTGAINSYTIDNVRAIYAIAPLSSVYLPSASSVNALMEPGGQMGFAKANCDEDIPGSDYAVLNAFANDLNAYGRLSGYNDIGGAWHAFFNDSWINTTLDVSPCGVWNDDYEPQRADAQFEVLEHVVSLMISKVRNGSAAPFPGFSTPQADSDNCGPSVPDEQTPVEISAFGDYSSDYIIVRLTYKNASNQTITRSWSTNWLLYNTATHTIPAGSSDARMRIMYAPWCYAAYFYTNCDGSNNGDCLITLDGTLKDTVVGIEDYCYYDDYY